MSMSGSVRGRFRKQWPGYNKRIPHANGESQTHYLGGLIENTLRPGVDNAGLMILTIYQHGITVSMQTAPVRWMAVVAVALLAGPCIVAAYAEPVPAAAISSGADGFAALGEAHVVAIHDISDRTYALVGSNDIQIVDITQPTEPLPVAAIRYDGYDFPGPRVNDIAIHDISNRTYALVVRDDVQIVDITRPDNPVPVAVMSHDDGFAAIHQPEVVDTYDVSGRAYALVGGEEGVQIIDITRPDNPVPVAVTLDDDAANWWIGVNDITIYEAAGKAHAFVITTSSAICGLTCTTPHSLHVIDITRPANPLPVSPANVQLVGDSIAIHDRANRTYALLTSPWSSTVHIADITHPTDTVPISTIQDNAGGFTELHGAAGIAIHDISNRTYAVVVGWFDSGVQIIDITDPAAPLPVAALNDDAGGFTELGGAHAVAIHDISNRTYAVVVGYEGVQIIDITRPASASAAPVPAACHIPAAARTAQIKHGGLRGADDITVHDMANRTYAVVVGGGEMRISDITRPAHPVLVAALSDAGGFTRLFRAENAAVHGIADGTYAVVVGAFDDGVQIIDITRPAHPVLVAAMFDYGSYAHGIALQTANPVAVLAGDRGGFTKLGGANDIAIYGISNGTYAVVASAGDDGVQIIDITRPDNPFPVAALSDAGRFIELDGGGSVAIAKTYGRTYAVVTSSADGNVQLVDVTDPASPVPVPVSPITTGPGWFGELSWVDDMYITQISGRTYAVVTSNLNDSVHIIDMTDPESPFLVPATSIADDTGGFDKPAWYHDVAITQISGRTYAVGTITGDDWVQIIDITDPASPIRIPPTTITFNEFAELNWANNSTLIQIAGRTYAASDSLNGDMYIIDITDPASPVPIASITAGPIGFGELRGASGIAVHDISNRTYAVVAASADDGVQIMDITQPDNPLPVAAITDNVDGFTELGGAAGIAIHDISNGTYTVVASAGDDGVQIIDITRPASPLPVAAITDDEGGFTELGGVSGVAIHDISNRTYAVVGGYEGVQIIDITRPANPLPAARLSGGPTAVIHDVSDRAHLLISYEHSTVHIIGIAHLATAGCPHN